MKKKYLFIGGARDGEWIEVKTDRKYIGLLEKEQPGPVSDMMGEIRTLRSCFYKKEYLMANDMTFEVFIERDITPQKMIKKLIEGYKQQSP